MLPFFNIQSAHQCQFSKNFQIVINDTYAVPSNGHGLCNKLFGETPPALSDPFYGVEEYELILYQIKIVIKPIQNG